MGKKDRKGGFAVVNRTFYTQNLSLGAYDTSQTRFVKFHLSTDFDDFTSPFSA